MRAGRLVRWYIRTRHGPEPGFLGGVVLIGSTDARADAGLPVTIGSTRAP